MKLVLLASNYFTDVTYTLFDSDMKKGNTLLFQVFYVKHMIARHVCLMGPRLFLSDVVALFSPSAGSPEGLGTWGTGPVPHQINFQ